MEKVGNDGIVIVKCTSVAATLAGRWYTASFSVKFANIHQSATFENRFHLLKKTQQYLSWIKIRNKVWKNGAADAVVQLQGWQWKRAELPGNPGAARPIGFQHDNCCPKKATIFGRRRQLKTIERQKICVFFRRKVERAWCALLDWLVRKWGLDLDFGSNWKQIWMQAQTHTSQRLEPFRKSLLRRDKYNQKQNQEHHNYQRQHCWISHKSASSGFVCVGNFLPNPLLCVTLVNLIEISTDRKHLLRSAPFRLRCQQTVNIFIPLFSSGVILTDHFCVSRF